jgi:phosphinothricin acetyltransferase
MSDHVPLRVKFRDPRRYASVTSWGARPDTMERMDSRFRIAPAGLEDLGWIAGIYHHYVRTSPATFEVEPRTDEAWRAWFGGFGGRGRYRLLVARDGERVLGYAASSTYRPRAAYAPSVETSVYVDAGSIGLGVGSGLLGALMSELATEDVHRACAGIALPNPASVRLHEGFGYRHVGTFTEQGRKFGRYWDVAWFERAFPDRSAEEAS